MDKHRIAFIICMMFNSIQAQNNIGILYGKSQQTGNDSSYCVMYNPQFAKLPQSLEVAKFYGVANFSTSYVCHKSDIPPTTMLSNKVAFVERGNCSFVEKATIVQDHKASALVVISQNGLSEPVPNASSDYERINIPLCLLLDKDFNHLMALGDNVEVKLFTPAHSRIDWNLVVIWLLATGTVTAGAFWSGIVKHQKVISKRRPRRRTREQQNEEDKLDEEDDKDDDSFDMSPQAIIVFVILMCGMLVSLYYFYDYLVYAVIGMFALAASTALYSCLVPLLLKIKCIGACRVPSNKIPVLRRRPEIRKICLFLFCASIAIWWAVERNKSYAWILQDTLGVVFCVHMMKTIRMPSLMACSILLSLLFVYDIFFVFITPLFTKSGQSIMVNVATGESSKSGEMLPMALKVPRIEASALSVCQLPYSLLGFGDMLVPGLLVSYAHGFDLQVGSKKIYFIANVIAYGVGLIITFVALAMMNTGQPALLYLVPCTLLTTVIIGACRHELRHLWHGKLKKSAKPKKSTPDAAAERVGNGSIQQDRHSSQTSRKSPNANKKSPKVNKDANSDDSDCEQPLLVDKGSSD